MLLLIKRYLTKGGRIIWAEEVALLEGDCCTAQHAKEAGIL